MTSQEDQDRLVRRFRRQADTAVQRSSPLYEHLLRGCVADLAQRGPTWLVARDRAGEPAGDALPLRLLAAVHQLVLRGRAPDLACYYPSVGGDQPLDSAWPAFRAVLEDQAEAVRAALDRPLQTNEVGRCAALLMGFADLVARTGRRLTVREIGASAGLNLNWFRYRYGTDASAWGPAGSAVRLLMPAGLAAVPAELQPPVDSRGCDRSPLNAADADDQLWLRACVWADQAGRLANLTAALAIAEQHPPCVTQADAVDWLDGQLAGPDEDTVTVVVQTIVDQYLTPEQRTGLASVMERAGRRLTGLAWLRMEPPDPADPYQGADGLAEVRLRTWPGDTDELIGFSGYHGDPVRRL